MIRHLGPADWGGYVTVASLMTLVAGLSEFGLGNIGVREYSTLGREARMHLIRNLMGLRLALTVLGLLLALTFGLLAGYSTTLLIGTALWGVGLMILFIQQAVGVPLVSRLQLGWVSAFSTFFARRPPSCSWLRSWRSGPDCCRSSLRRYQWASSCLLLPFRSREAWCLSFPGSTAASGRGSCA